MDGRGKTKKLGDVLNEDLKRLYENYDKNRAPFAKREKKQKSELPPRQEPVYEEEKPERSKSQEFSFEADSDWLTIYPE